MLKSRTTTAPGRPFKPGVSGNPAGRPPGVSGIRKVILKALKVKRDGAKTVDILVAVLTDKALSGNLAAAKLLIEYAYGKPSTVLEAVDLADKQLTMVEILRRGNDCRSMLTLPDLAALKAAVPGGSQEIPSDREDGGNPYQKPDPVDVTATGKPE